MSTLEHKHNLTHKSNHCATPTTNIDHDDSIDILNNNNSFQHEIYNPHSSLPSPYLAFCKYFYHPNNSWLNDRTISIFNDFTKYNKHKLTELELISINTQLPIAQFIVDTYTQCVIKHNWTINTFMEKSKFLSSIPKTSKPWQSIRKHLGEYSKYIQCIPTIGIATNNYIEDSLDDEDEIDNNDDNIHMVYNGIEHNKKRILLYIERIHQMLRNRSIAQQMDVIFIPELLDWINGRYFSKLNIKYHLISDGNTTIGSHENIISRTIRDFIKDAAFKRCVLLIMGTSSNIAKDKIYIFEPLNNDRIPQEICDFTELPWICNTKLPILPQFELEQYNALCFSFHFHSNGAERVYFSYGSSNIMRVFKHNIQRVLSVFCTDNKIYESWIKNEEFMDKQYNLFINTYFADLKLITTDTSHTNLMKWPKLNDYSCVASTSQYIGSVGCILEENEVNLNQKEQYDHLIEFNYPKLVTNGDDMVSANDTIICTCINVGYSARQIWAKSCSAGNTQIAYLRDLYPNLMHEFNYLTYYDKQSPTLDQIRPFFERYKSPTATSVNAPYINISKFNAFFAWFESICKIINDLSEISHPSVDILAGLFYNQKTAKNKLKHKRKGTFILRLGLHPNQLRVTYKNETGEIERLLLKRISDNGIYKIHKTNRADSIFNLVMSHSKLNFFYTPNESISKMSIITKSNASSLSVIHPIQIPSTSTLMVQSMTKHIDEKEVVNATTDDDIFSNDGDNINKINIQKPGDKQHKKLQNKLHTERTKTGSISAFKRQIDAHCLMQQSVTEHTDDEVAFDMMILSDIDEDVAEELPITKSTETVDYNIRNKLFQYMESRIKQIGMEDIITVYGPGNSNNSKKSPNRSNKQNNNDNNSGSNQGNNNNNNNNNNRSNGNNGNSGNNNFNGGSSGGDDGKDNDKNNRNIGSSEDDSDNEEDEEEKKDKDKEVEEFLKLLNMSRTIDDDTYRNKLSTFSPVTVHQVTEEWSRVNAEMQRLSGLVVSMQNETEKQKQILIPKTNPKQKQKSKPKSKAKSIAKQNGNLKNYTPQNPKSIYRIPREFTTQTMRSRISEDIDYDFMIKSLGIVSKNKKNNKKNKRNKTNKHLKHDDIKIFNFDIHDKENNENLYFVAKRIVNPSEHRGYEWIINELLTRNEITTRYKLSPPSPPVIEEVDEMKNVEQKIMESKEDIINKTNWNKVPIYNRINNKRRMTLSLTKPEFIKQFIDNIDLMDQVNLIPIVMFGQNDKYWVEYIWIVTIEDDVDIGIAFKYIKSNKTVTVSGIHLDKKYIFKQHQVIAPSHQYENFMNFTSRITDLSIGNPDEPINKIRALQGQVKKLQEEKFELEEKLKANYVFPFRSLSTDSQYSTTPLTLDTITEPATSRSLTNSSMANSSLTNIYCCTSPSISSFNHNTISNQPHFHSYTSAMDITTTELTPEDQHSYHPSPQNQQ